MRNGDSVGTMTGIMPQCVRRIARFAWCLAIFASVVTAQSAMTRLPYHDVFAYRSYLPDGQGTKGSPKKVKTPKPRMEGSFTGGYIEDAIVRTQIRVRFDAEFSRFLQRTWRTIGMLPDLGSISL